MNDYDEAHLYDGSEEYADSVDHALTLIGELYVDDEFYDTLYYERGYDQLDDWPLADV